MRSLRLRPSALLFRLLVAASAFALGLGAWGVWPRPDAPAPTVVPTVTSCGAPDVAEVSISDTPADGTEEKGPAVEGRYINYGYGYSVEIPAGMVGLGSMPFTPQHGFGIDLDHPRSTAWTHGPEFPKSYLYVDGSYNSLMWPRLDDASDSNLSFLREKGHRVRVRLRKATRLGGLPALRVVALYEQEGEEMVSDAVFAFEREDGGEATVVHTLSLSTPRAKYERDRPVLEALMKSWCLQPVE